MNFLKGLSYIATILWIMYWAFQLKEITKQTQIMAAQLSWQKQQLSLAEKINQLDFIYKVNKDILTTEFKNKAISLQKNIPIKNLYDYLDNYELIWDLHNCYKVLDKHTLHRDFLRYIKATCNSKIVYNWLKNAQQQKNLKYTHLWLINFCCKYSNKQYQNFYCQMPKPSCKNIYVK